MTPSTSSGSTQLDTSAEKATSFDGAQKQEFEETMKEEVVDVSTIDVENQGKPPAHVPISNRNAVILFIGLVMATFLASLDGTIIATALPKIASDFRAKEQMSWVATAYLLTYNAFQPLYGKFSDIFGRKVMIMFAIVTFMIGSAGAGAAPSMTFLIVFRSIQGLGGAGLLSIVLIIISDIFPIDQRAKYQSIIWSVFGISSVIGPLVGGYLVEHSTWRWCFYLNLPLGVVTVASVIIFLRLPFERQDLKTQLARIDYGGTIMIIIAVICLLLPITWGGTTYAWNSPIIISLFCVAAVLIAILIWIETKAVEAVIPPRLFKNFTVCVLFGVNFMTGMGFMGVIFYIPVYFQVVHGVGATASGLRLLPLVLGLVASSIISGALFAKIKDIRIFIWIGTAMVAAGIGICILLDDVSSMVQQMGSLLVIGLGIGLILQTCMLAVQAAVEKEDMAVVTALCGFMNSIGGGIGIAMCSSLFNNRLAQKIGEFDMETLMILAQYHIDESITVVQTLPDGPKALVIGAYVATFKFIFTCLLPIACLTFLLSLTIKRLRLLDPSEMIMGAA